MHFYRATNVIQCIHSVDHDEPILELILPELKNESEMIQPEMIMNGLSPQQVNESLRQYYNLIRHKGSDEIIVSEIKIKIRSNYVASLLILDCPGLAPSTPFSNSDKISSDILKKYLNSNSRNNVTYHPIICSNITSECIDGIWGSLSELIKGGAKFSCSTLILTHIDKVQYHSPESYYVPCVCILKSCYSFVTSPNIRVPMIIMRTTHQMKKKRC